MLRGGISIKVGHDEALDEGGGQGWSTAKLPQRPLLATTTTATAVTIVTIAIVATVTQRASLACRNRAPNPGQG